MLATLPFLCLRWCNVDKRQLEIVGRDFGCVLVRDRCSVTASGCVLPRPMGSVVAARENAFGSLSFEPRSHE